MKIFFKVQVYLACSLVISFDWEAYKCSFNAQFYIHFSFSL